MKKWIYNVLIIFFALVLLVSGGMLAAYYLDAYTQQNRYDDLASLRGNTATISRPDPLAEETLPEPTEPELVTVTDPETGESVQVLSEFAQLYVMNNDIVGWLTVPGTVIDYPVMQTPDSPDYYLYRNFDKEDNKRGCLYVREVCDVFAPSDNLTVYGHHMRDGSMFGQLEKYRDPAFREENPCFWFDTLTERHTYQVIAVFLTTATVDEGFYYHAFVEAQSPEEFDEFVQTCHDLQLYDTGLSAQYGDKLICLSTCEYTHPLQNGRLVVAAVRIT